MSKTENRLNQREANVNKKSDMMLAREKKVTEREKTLVRKTEELERAGRIVSGTHEFLDLAERHSNRRLQLARRGDGLRI